jgi:hypothetical protein
MSERAQGVSPPYETRDVTGRMAVWFAVGFTVSVVVLVAVMTWYYVGVWPMTDMPKAREEVRRGPQEAWAPTLQIDPQADLDDLRRRSAERLGSSGWIDRDRGIAHIPIEDAMRLYIERRRGGEATQ